ncbi:MAG TPA: tetratricopeptide repeat protein [Blastocatellia bacterium]|nr:tetratricopeptide repeat protein [Blastocatellia bacterium]
MSKHQSENIRARFATALSSNEEQIDLAEAALLIAGEEYPHLNVLAYVEKLDRFGDLAREQADAARGAHGTILAINTVIFEELGFHGNRENYYDPRNSFLNEVIDRRLGIPITLAVVYMAVARRVGFGVHGVAMPHHFIVKHIHEGGEIFIDPFNGGQVMGEAECGELLDQVSGGRMKLESEYLCAATNKQILTRMLTNLLGIYAESNDYGRALAALDRILLINPDSPSHVRDRGLLLAALGDAHHALAELARYLQLAPEAADAAAIREQMKTIRGTHARLN